MKYNTIIGVRLRLFWILAISVSLTVIMGSGCGGEGSRHAADKDKSEMGKNIEVVGEISVRGSDMAPLILLLSDDGTTYTIQPSPVALELARLEGMRVTIEGSARTPADEGPALLDARTYRILPLESGDEPLVGWIDEVNGGCVLRENDGTEWRVTGDLVSHLAGFDGAKAWVIGERHHADSSKREIHVTGYGILSRSD